MPYDGSQQAGNQIAPEGNQLQDHSHLILEEFGVLNSTNATDLYERVREPGMSVCASWSDSTVPAEDGDL